MPSSEEENMQLFRELTPEYQAKYLKYAKDTEGYGPANVGYFQVVNSARDMGVSVDNTIGSPSTKYYGTKFHDAFFNNQKKPLGSLGK